MRKTPSAGAEARPARRARRKRASFVLVVPLGLTGDFGVNGPHLVCESLGAETSELEAFNTGPWPISLGA